MVSKANSENKKLYEDLATAQVESKRNYDIVNTWALSTKRYGCYISDLYTMLGSTLEAGEVQALRGTYLIDLVSSPMQLKKTKPNGKLKLKGSS